MLVLDGNDRLIRIKGIERARTGPASFMAGGSLKKVAGNIVAAVDASLVEQGYHIQLVIYSKVPLDYRLWLGPLNQEPPDGWDI